VFDTQNIAQNVDNFKAVKCHCTNGLLCVLYYTLELSNEPSLNAVHHVNLQHFPS